MGPSSRLWPLFAVVPFLLESTMAVRRSPRRSALSVLSSGAYDMYDTTMTCVWAQVDASFIAIESLTDQPDAAKANPDGVLFWNLAIGVGFAALWISIVWNKAAVQTALGGRLNVWRHLLFHNSGSEVLFGSLLTVVTSSTMDYLIAEPTESETGASGLQRTSLLFKPVQGHLSYLLQAFPIVSAVLMVVVVAYILDPSLEWHPEAVDEPNPAASRGGPSRAAATTVEETGIIQTVISGVSVAVAALQHGLVPSIVTTAPLPATVSPSAAITARVALCTLGILVVEYGPELTEDVISTVFYGATVLLSMAFSDGVHQLASSKRMELAMNLLRYLALAMFQVYPTMRQHGFLFAEAVWVTFWHAGLAVATAGWLSEAITSAISTSMAHQFRGSSFADIAARWGSYAVIDMCACWFAVVRGEAVAELLLAHYTKLDTNGNAVPFSAAFSLLFTIGVIVFVVGVVRVYAGVVAAAYAFVPVVSMKQGRLRLALVTGPARRVHRQNGDSIATAAVSPGLRKRFRKLIKSVAEQAGGLATALRSTAADGSVSGEAAATKRSRGLRASRVRKSFDTTPILTFLHDLWTYKRMLDTPAGKVAQNTLSFECVFEAQMQVPSGVTATVPGFSIELSNKTMPPRHATLWQQLRRWAQDLLDLDQPSLCNIARLSSLSQEGLARALPHDMSGDRKECTAAVRQVAAGESAGHFLRIDPSGCEVDKLTGLHKVRTLVGFRAEVDVRGLFLAVASLDGADGIVAAMHEVQARVRASAFEALRLVLELATGKGVKSARVGRGRKLHTELAQYGGFTVLVVAPNPLTPFTDVMSEHCLLDTTQAVPEMHGESILDQIFSSLPSWLVSVLDGIRESSAADVRRVHRVHVTSTIHDLRDRELKHLTEGEAPLAVISDALDALAMDMEALVSCRMIVAEQVRSSSFSHDYTLDDVKIATSDLLVALLHCNHGIHILIDATRQLRHQCASRASALSSSASVSAGLRNAHDRLLGRLIRWSSDLSASMVESAIVSAAAILSHTSSSGFAWQAIQSVDALRCLGLAAVVFSMHSLGDKAVGRPFDDVVFRQSRLELLGIGVGDTHSSHQDDEARFQDKPAWQRNLDREADRERIEGKDKGGSSQSDTDGSDDDDGDFSDADDSKATAQASGDASGVARFSQGPQTIARVSAGGAGASACVPPSSPVAADVDPAGPSSSPPAAATPYGHSPEEDADRRRLCEANDASPVAIAIERWIPATLLHEAGSAVVVEPSCVISARPGARQGLDELLAMRNGVEPEKAEIARSCIGALKLAVDSPTTSLQPAQVSTALDAGSRLAHLLALQASAKHGRDDSQQRRVTVLLAWGVLRVFAALADDASFTMPPAISAAFLAAHAVLREECATMAGFAVP